MAPKLWWGSGSSWCWRIQIVLEEKGIDYESILISFSEREHKKPPVSTLNRRGQVPTFVDGDVVICESSAVCHYLEAAYPDSGVKLIPDDLKTKAEVLQFMYESDNLYTVFRCVAFDYFMPAFKAGTVDPTEHKEKVAPVKAELALWESSLTGKKYLVNETFTMADAFFYPFLASFIRWGLDLEKAGFPALAAYDAHMSVKESVQKTAPPHWKEGPGTPAFANV